MMGQITWFCWAVVGPVRETLLWFFFSLPALVCGLMDGLRYGAFGSYCGMCDLFLKGYILTTMMLRIFYHYEFFIYLLFSFLISFIFYLFFPSISRLPGSIDHWFSRCYCFVCFTVYLMGSKRQYHWAIFKTLLSVLPVSREKKKTMSLALGAIHFIHDKP